MFETKVTPEGVIQVVVAKTGTLWATVPCVEQAAIIVSALNAYGK